MMVHFTISCGGSKFPNVCNGPLLVVLNFLVIFPMFLSFLVLFLMFLSLPWCCSSPLVWLLVNQTPPPFCVHDCLLLSGLELPGLLCIILELPLVLFLSLGTTFDESNLPSSFHCVCDGLLLGGFKFFNPFPSVCELPLVMFLSISVAFDESNPPSFVLVMVFFLMFLSFPWCDS